MDLGQPTDADDDNTSLERMLLQFPGATFVLPPAVGLSIVEMAVVSGALAELAIMAAPIPAKFHAIATAIKPLAESASKVAKASTLLPVRKTLVAPILPDPC